MNNKNLHLDMDSISSKIARNYLATVCSICVFFVGAQSTDITQMVNPVTGDLNYSLPIMEVPGPEGSYPITLNYAAGIRIDQQSSWVGLGWNLQPGAITRSISRFPDDYKGDAVRLIQTDPGDCQSKDIPANFFESLAYAWISFIADFVYDYDIFKTSRSSNPGIWDWRVTTRTVSKSFLFFRYDRDIVVCWSLNKDLDEKGYGFLYQSNLLEGVGATGQRTYSSPTPHTVGRSKDFYNQASDYFQKHEEGLLYNNTNPIYWATDNYFVSAAGLGGTLKPIRFENPSAATSYNTNQYYSGRTALKKIQVVPEVDTRPQFVFMNDQSNKYDYLKTASNSFDLDYNLQANINTDPGPETTAIPAVQSAALGEEEANRDGFINGHLRRGNSVEWYTNKQISDGDAYADGFMNFSSNFTRQEVPNGENTNYYPNHGIGGFKVTDTKGVTYHFSIPVYVLSHKTTFIKETFESIESYEEPYAAQWLLTAITGPDFKDSGSESGAVDLNDEGYFVIFNYGKFSEHKKTNVPREGFSMDNKELPDAMTKVEIISQDYYLNEIRTRTHTALFVKERSTKNGSYGEIANGNQYSVRRLDLNEIILLSNKNYASLKTQMALSGSGDSGYTLLEYPDNVITVEDIAPTGVANLLTSYRINSTGFKYFPMNKNTALQQIATYGKQKLTNIPTFQFDYVQYKDGGFDQEHYIRYDKNNYNAWGFYNDYSGETVISRENVNPGQAKAHSLRNIYTPDNEKISIEYESDDYRSISGVSIGHRLAGGIRVKSITIEDRITTNKYSTEFEYHNGSGQSSGVVTKEPQIGKYNNVEYPFEEIYGYPVEEVYYGRVKQTNKVNGHILGGTEWEYVTPDQNMVQVNVLDQSNWTYPDAVPGDGWPSEYHLKQRSYETIYDHDLLGAPIATRTFDAQGSYVNETKYFYEDSDLGELTQGLHLFDEMYRNYDQPYNTSSSDDGIDESVIRHKNARFINSLSSYKRKRLSKVESYNYVANSKSIMYNGEYDFITGRPEKTIVVNDNRTILQEVIPAYKISEYTSAGSGVSGMDFMDAGGSNMLEQQAYTSSFIINDVAEPINFSSLQKVSLLQASAQTWEHNGNNWLSGTSYAHVTGNLNSNGTLPILTSGEQFNWSSSTPSNNWFPSTQVTARNDFSNVVESQDIDGNYSSQRLSVDNSRVLISAQNARLKEIVFSGAERAWNSNGFNSSMDHNSGVLSTTKAHSGSSSLRLGGGLRGYEYKTTIDDDLNGKTLEAVFWANRGNGLLNNIQLRYSIDGNSTSLNGASEAIQVGDWSLFKFEIPINESVVSNQQLTISVHNTGSGDVFIDDFRVAPLDAIVECYVYDTYGNVSHTINNQHFYTHTITDENHVVVEVRRERANGVHKVEESSYNYSKPN